MKLFLCSIFLFCLFYSNIKAQSDWDRESQEYYTILMDEFRSDHYEAAQEPLEWLLKNRSDLPRNVYIIGEKIYQSLGKTSKTKSQKKYYQKALKNIQQKRIELFGR